MRALLARPVDSDYTSGEEYENSAPASFGLPELPVLYAKVAVSPTVTAWVTSDGVLLWGTSSGTKYDLETIRIEHGMLVLPDQMLGIGDAAAAQLQAALTKCLRLFGNSDPLDSAEVAVPRDYETGDADDIGEVALTQSIGEGASSREGPAIAQKRRRSSS